MIKLLVLIIFFSIPLFSLFKLIESFFSSKNRRFKIRGWIEGFYTFLIIFICILGFVFTFDEVGTGQPLSQYEVGGEYLQGYTSLSFNHILTVLVFFVLGIIAYIILKSRWEGLSPIIYTVCCSLLIINIIFTAVYYYHTSVNFHMATLDVEITVWTLRLGFACLSLLYMAELMNSLREFLERERLLKREYENRLLNILYGLCLKYQTMPLLWIVSLFPVLVGIQLILVIFGQQPDSFIRVFLDTSGYNYSKVPPPPPIIVPGDSHYLCTVSVKGHKGLVKPLRSGIRGGKRILVNRQLLVANAFENILEQYTPKFHRFIRYIYDKYGYPLSRHINTSLAADITYILMKPLEWFFLLVLYTVDRNPENRINIQYSELRR